MRAALGLALALVACSDGRWRDTLAAYDAVAMACDQSETLAFSDYGRWDLGQHGTPILETNPLLGREPSPALLIGELVGVEVGIWALHHFGPHWYTDAGLVAVGAVETYANVRNVQYVAPCGVGPGSLQIVKAPPP